MRIIVAVSLASLMGFVPAAGQPAPQPRTIPAGTSFNVLLQSALTSATAKADQRFDTATIEAVPAAGAAAIEAGAVVRGFVSSVRPSTRESQTGQLTLSFDELRLGGRAIRLRASVVAVLDPKPADASRRASAGVAVGGDGRFGLPAFADVMLTGGGSIVAAGGGDVTLPVGIVLRLRLDQALELTAPPLAHAR